MLAKKLIVFSVAVVVFCCSFLAGADTARLGVRIERNVPVPMRDGTILRADVQRPDRGGPYPVLVHRTPYGRGGGAYYWFVQAGYIVVTQDVRGRYASDGTWESSRRLDTHDAEDGYDTIEWAAKLPGSNGKVGAFGFSYDAFLVWRLASLQPPSLVATWARSIPGRHTNLEGPGTIRPGRRLGWWLNIMSPEARRRANRPGVHRKWEALKLWEQGESEKWINWLPWLELPREVFEDETDAVKYWLRNPHIDPWKLDEGCKDISVPNINVTGWYDHCNDDMLLYKTMVKEAKTSAAREGSKIIIGPWSHGPTGRRSGGIDFGPNARLSLGELQFRWFDYWLKGKQNGVDKDAPVRIFVMGDNKWRGEQCWPLERTKERIFFITSRGQANTPSGDGKIIDERPLFCGTDVYVYDPNDPVPSLYGPSMTPCAADQRPLANREDILVYQSEPLTERLEVTGDPVVELYAASSAPDTDWFVRLIDVAPDGLARDVSYGVVRARYRKGLDKPDLIEPGEVVKYTIRMRPTSNAFLPGHRIRLDITSSDFPNYDRNHNTAADQNADATLATASQIIHHGGERTTRIVLPWVPNQTGEEKPTEEDTREPVLEKQMYPLHQAVAEGNLEQAKLLISGGVDVNVKDEEGRSPLHYAVEAGRKEMVQLLVKAGADVNAGPENLLHAAVENDHAAIVEYLIDHGADVNAGGSGRPLRRAIYYGNIEMVKLLIAKGADISVNSWLALYEALDEGHSDIVELLIQKGADINAKDESGYSLLHHAFHRNNLDIADLIIAKGADIQIKPPAGLTLLHYMAAHGRQDIVEKLLAEGAKVDERDEVYEFTALHYAARFGCKNAAGALIASGADIKAKDKWDYQPIHWAAYHDRTDVVKLLIAKGADVNAKTSLGQTPLELATPRRNTATIEVLRKHGAK